MTHFEKIEQASKEDWVDFISDRSCELCPAKYMCDIGTYCKENIEEWLNSEAE